MTDPIVLTELIRFVAMNSTLANLGNLGMKSIVKDAGAIVENGKNKV